MHQTTSTTSRTGTRRWAFLGLLAAMLLLALAQAVPALAASSPFDGGPLAVDTATAVANDHTVYAMRFSATTGGTYPLDADTTYYVKLRFTPNADGSPAGVDNRGFTWNGASGAWAQERDDWTAFPTVTTDGTGAIAQSDWFYCKFGDTTKSGTYYLLVSLSTGASGSTRNGNVVDPGHGVRHDERGSVGASMASTTPPTYTVKRADVVDYALPTTRSHCSSPRRTARRRRRRWRCGRRAVRLRCRTAASDMAVPIGQQLPGPGGRQQDHGLAGLERASP